MTTNDSRSPEASHDDTVIENLLTEAGINDPGDAGLLKPDLLSIRALARGPQPTPRGELAALLTGANTDTTAAQESETISSLEAHRTKRHTRLAIAAAALSLSLGAGAAAAVASPDLRETIQNTVSTLIQALAPAGNANRPGTPTPSPASAGPGATAPMAPSPPTVRPVKPDLPAQTTQSPARPETSDSLPHPEPTPEFNTPPDGPNPTRPEPEIPAPAPPAQPDTPAPARPRPDTTPVPSPPAPAPASGNQAPPHPARP